MNPNEANLDPAVEHYISTLVEDQFPLVYQELTPVFVEFVKAYYVWLESSGNPLYYSRRWLELQDIDTTSDDFIIYFKQKYLKNIQLETTSDVRLMVKHCLDIFRSKGSPWGIDLLFRLVFGVGADIYFPRNDLLIPSSGKWHVPKYLEISPQASLANKIFVGRQIIGSQSKATAFVERLVRKRIGTSFVEVLYISAILGSFTTGEKINIQNEPLDFSLCPTIIGSLTTLDIVDGSSGFEVGDNVDLLGTNGEGGIARIASVDSLTGLVNFNLLYGGWGYTEYTQLFVSDHILTLTNIVSNSSFNSNQYFGWFETLVQPYAQMNYLNASDTLDVGAKIFTYFANNAQAGQGVILANSPVDANSGLLTVSVLSGNLVNLGFFTTGNAIGANLSVSNGYIDLTATGSVIGETTDVTLTVNSVVGTFQAGEQVTSNTSNAILKDFSVSGSSGTIKLSNTFSLFRKNSSIKGVTSGAVATVNSVSLSVGVTATNGTFTTLANNFTYGGANLSNGNILTISTGAGASVNISSILRNTEVDDLTTDLITTVGNVVLDAVTYGMSNGAANGSTIISHSVFNSEVNVGSISMLININPGENYTFAPMVRVYDPIVYSYQRRGWNLTFANASGSFQAGEIVVQTSSGAQGNVIFANGSNLLVQRQTLTPTFAYSNSTPNTQIVGLLSNTFANVVGTGIDWVSPDTNIGSLICGLNAVVQTNTVTGIGSAKTMTIIDSGFSYQEGTDVTFSKDGTNIGLAKVHLGKYGSGTGYYQDRNGFLSDSKKLFDGDYWQYFSYEVRSSLSIDKYEDILKKVLHVAGMKYFGALYHSSTVTSESSGLIQSIDITPANNAMGGPLDDSAAYFLIFA